mmetsp:Transcript_126151/g.299565  ORF Transcript_126151/g.299565 Transcript_126151/m.299565 type:complete len:221 (+) Transcript_126151:433-1095(+)
MRRQPWGRHGVVPWKAKKVNRRHGQKRGIAKQVGVVLHLLWCNQELPRAAALEEPQGMVCWYEAVGLAMNEQCRAGDVRNDPVVRKALCEGPGCYSPDDALHGCFDGCKSRDQDETSDGILRSEIHCGSAPQGSPEEHDLGIPDSYLIHQIPQNCQRHFVESLLRRFPMAEHPIAGVLWCKNIHFELISEVPENRESHPQIFRVGVEEHDDRGGLGRGKP